MRDENRAELLGDLLPRSAKRIASVLVAKYQTPYGLTFEEAHYVLGRSPCSGGKDPGHEP